jgi:hypothetical protein
MRSSACCCSSVRVGSMVAPVGSTTCRVTRRQRQQLSCLSWTRCNAKGQQSERRTRSL